MNIFTIENQLIYTEYLEFINSVNILAITIQESAKDKIPIEEDLEPILLVIQQCFNTHYLAYNLGY